MPPQLCGFVQRFLASRSGGWSGGRQSWNGRCARCVASQPATGLRPAPTPHFSDQRKEKNLQPGQGQMALAPQRNPLVPQQPQRPQRQRRRAQPERSEDRWLQMPQCVHCLRCAPNPTFLQQGTESNRPPRATPILSAGSAPARAAVAVVVAVAVAGRHCRAWAPPAQVARHVPGRHRNNPAGRSVAERRFAPGFARSRG